MHPPKARNRIIGQGKVFIHVEQIIQPRCCCNFQATIVCCSLVNAQHHGDMKSLPEGGKRWCILVGRKTLPSGEFEVYFLLEQRRAFVNQQR